MKLRLKPLYDSVIIQTKEMEEISSGGIYIPDVAKQKPTIGTVISTGPECKQVKVNDKVAYGSYAGTEMMVEEKKYLAILEKDVLAIIEEVKE